ncbi:peptidase M27 [Clostridium botulinum]|uniref:Botulinum neurotoxin type H n=1 Tax=Clostridium botulinum TaxID=1491 RepID=A0ABD7CG10_CLOBO|nr:botulinum neurotoxin type H [Clostridium botulinum]KGO15617.1 peptidase M27 [Clostridium botulinum]QRI51976.1 botulinum neurotoxin type H [Clostridium botulinum]
MPVVINSFNYDDPVNDNTIIYIRPPYYETSNTYFKAFQIMDNVWIIPERYRLGIDPSLFNPPVSLKAGSDGYFDPNYLSTNTEKNKYLQIMIKLFKRINSKPAGQILLEEIKNAIPYLGNSYTQEEQFTTNNRTVSFNVKLANGNIVQQMANLIIWGPGPDLTTNKTGGIIYSPYQSMEATPYKDGFGSIMTVEFSPEYATAFNDISIASHSPSLFIKDPALILMHELIHVLHGLYGTYITEYKITPNVVQSYMKVTKPITSAEFLTFGGRDRNIVPQSIQSQLYNKVLSDYKRIASRLNKVNTATALINIDEFKNLYEWKYQFAKDSNGVYSVDLNKFEQLYKKIYSFTEFNLAYEFKIKTRLGYLAENFGPFYLPNLLDDSIYTEVDGFNIGALSINYQGQNIGSDINSIKKLQGQGVVSRVVRLCSNSNTKNSLCITVNNRDLFFIASQESYGENTINTYKEIDDTTTLDPSFEDILDKVILNFNEQVIPQMPNRNVSTDIQKDNYIPKYDYNRTDIIDSYEVGRNYNTFFYLNAQKFSPNESNITLTSSFDTGLLEGSKVYTFFSSDFINNINKPVQALLFIEWVKQVIRDFTTEATKTSTVDKLKDISLVVPYIGLALNIGDEIYKQHFAEAVELVGAGLLLEFSPEFLIPTLLIFTIKGYLTGSIRDKDKIIKTLDNALNVRDQKWKELYRWVVSKWLTTINTQFNKRKEQMYKALKNQATAIKKIIENKYNNYTTDEKSKIDSSYNINEIERTLNEKINLAMKNIEQFITESSIAYLINIINNETIQKLKSYDDLVRRYLLGYIRNHSSILGNSVEELNSKVNNHLDNGIPFELSSYTNDSLLIRYFNKNYGELKYNCILNIKYEMDRDKLVDSSGYRSRINIGTGVKFSEIDKNQVQLSNLESSKIEVILNNGVIYNSMYENFSTSFWIRIPKYFRNINNEYKIISCMQNNSGWEVSLNFSNMNSKIIWTLQDTEGIKKTVVFQYTQNINISDYINRWIFVTITNNRLSNSKIYINGRLINEESISDLGNIHASNNIMFKLDGCRDPHRYIWIKYFNLFDKELNKKEIKDLYDNQSNSGILKDFWGDYLQYDKPYYMLNLYDPNKYLDVNNVGIRGYMYLKGPRGRIVTTNIYLNSTLYMGTKFIIKKYASGNKDNIVRNNDRVYINVVVKNKEYRLATNASQAGVEKILSAVEIPDVGNLSQVVVMKSENDQGIRNKCKMNLQDNNGNDIGFIGFHQFNNIAKLVASNWYNRQIGKASRTFGCSWEFIPVDDGWGESSL